MLELRWWVLLKRTGLVQMEVSGGGLNIPALVVYAVRRQAVVWEENQAQWAAAVHPCNLTPMHCKEVVQWGGKVMIVRKGCLVVSRRRAPINYVYSYIIFHTFSDTVPFYYSVVIQALFWRGRIWGVLLVILFGSWWCGSHSVFLIPPTPSYIIPLLVLKISQMTRAKDLNR